MNYVWHTTGCQFTEIAPAGFRILAALHAAAQKIGHDLTITSACDGQHSGPTDPHHSGQAYDIRVHDLPNAADALTAIMNELGDPKPGSGGWVTDLFFGWLEAAGTANAHIHVQLRRGESYPSTVQPVPGLAPDLAE